MAMKHSVPESLQQRINLQDDSIDEECVREGTPGVFLQKSHQETEADQHHDVDILKHGVIGLIELAIVVTLNTNEDPIEDNNDDLENER